MRKALEDVGWIVTEARNALEALRVLDTHTPDAILLDMQMPVLDGRGFARAYRARGGRQVPIVVMTAAVNARTSARKINADDVLGKPFDLEELDRVLSRFIPHDSP